MSTGDAKSLLPSLVPELANIHSAPDFLSCTARWKDLGASLNALADADAINSIIRARHMLAHWAWWQFLREQILPRLEMEMRQHMPGVVSQSFWLSPLVRKISKSYDAGEKALSIAFKDVYPSCHNFSRLQEAKIFNCNTLASGGELSRSISMHSLSVLAQWAGLQPLCHSGKGGKRCVDDLWDIQGRMLNNIMDFGEPGLFLLEETFRAFSTPIPYVYETRSCFDENLVDKIVQMTVMDSPAKAKAVQSLRRFVHVVACDIESIVCPEKVPERESESPSVDDSVPHRAEKHCAMVICNWLRKVAGVQLGNAFDITEDEQILTSCAWISTKDDIRNPFREAATSRSIFLTSDIDTDFLRTRAGLFSLLIHRGVTFGSQFLIDKRIVKFQTFQDWVQMSQFEEDYVCNLCAYGQPIGGRGSRHAQTYWDLTGDWEVWIGAFKPQLPSFKNLFQMLESLGLPQFGPLLIFLLAGDLVLGGVACFPSQEEFGATVLEVNKGPIRLLEAFHVVPENRSGRISEDCIRSFVEVYRLAKESLLSTGEAELMPDLFSYEYACCKAWRALQAGADSGILS